MKTEIPLHLAHKPICVLPYEKFDGKYADDTDAKYISIGLAQWDNSELSVKILRHSGNKWSRQSEELPLHRPIDMTIFLALTLFGRTLCVSPNTFSNQDAFVDIECINQMPYELNDLESFRKKRKNEFESLKKRFGTLLKVLENLKKDGKI